MCASRNFNVAIREGNSWAVCDMENGQISIWRRLGMELPTIQKRKRLRVSEVNPHLICVLCGGYYIDATTITECLHTFCKTCIVGYLEASKHCPVCDNLVHKTKPHLRLRPDHTLQDLVYKLVPGLFKDEMNKRREFYKDEIQSGKLGENGIPEDRERIIYAQDEQISLILELSSNGRPPLSPSTKSAKHHRLEAADRRYLQCPANITVGHLKKFLKMKFNLCDRFQIDFFHADEILHDHYSLVDIAYIYSWRRKGPLSLYYTVFTNPAKRFKADQEEDVAIDAEIQTKEVDISKVSERTETSGYLTDDDKDMDISAPDRSLESNTLPESGSNDSFELDSSDLESVKLTEDRALHKPCDTDDNTMEKVDSESNEKCDTKTVNQVDTKVDSTKEEIMESDLETGKEASSINTTQELPKNQCTDTDAIQVKVSKRDEACEKTAKKHENKFERESSVGEKEDKGNPDTESAKADVEEPECGEKEKCEPKEPKTEKVHTSEASTSTTCTNESDMQIVAATKENCHRTSLKDDDISEPVVSSTQNTQACQTEPPEPFSEKFDLPHSSDFEKPVSQPTNSTAKVDVSCETDNFVTMRQLSVESVSVSTETDVDGSFSSDRKSSVDCATDVFDFPKSTSDVKITVDCSTDSRDFQETVINNKRKKFADCSTEMEDVSIHNKRKALSVDCSTEMEDISVNNKRKALSVDCSTEIEEMDIEHLRSKSPDSLDLKQNNKRTETKGTKRSNSYSAYSPKTSYMAQPLSPTKITLKFSATKSPQENSKPCQTPKPQSQVTGFQSKYQSFVMELPEKTFNSENKPEKRVHTTLPAKTSENYKQTYMNTISTSTKRSQSKTGRPRGRPPKIKPPEQVDIHKEKKHKSRSHSPKHKKHTEKQEKYPTNSNTHAVGSKRTSSSNPYTWINKVTPSTKHHHAEKKQPKSKGIESAKERPAGELKIPKQFLYFSNGQYTLATESSLATLKQSSPISPTRTVWETQTSSYGDKHSKSEKVKDKDKKTDTSEKVENEKQISKNESAKNSNNCEKTNVSKSEIIDTEKSLTSLESKVNDKNGNEQKTRPSVSSSSTEAVTSGSSQTSDTSKETISSTSEKFPEYRHQSPFFASYSRLGVHRPSTHLNIPNFTSHFNTAHSLFNHGRYTSDRLGIPIYRSMSLSDPKAVNMSVPSSKTQDKQRLEPISSPCGFLTQYPYIGLSHLQSHISSSLPSAVSHKGFSVDSLKSQTSSLALSPVGSSSTVSQSKGSIKSGGHRKGKEKSIDNIISELTEMRTKKETTAQEQINGIDLSTKSSRQNAKSFTTNNNDKVDRYAFPGEDEDANRVSPKKGTV